MPASISGALAGKEQYGIRELKNKYLLIKP
jgi:hypothetical protein